MTGFEREGKNQAVFFFSQFYKIVPGIKLLSGEKKKSNVAHM